MLIDFAIQLLNGFKSGSLNVSENGKKSIQLYGDKNDKIINILDFSFNTPSTKDIFTQLGRAREFAEKLKEENITIRVSSKGKLVMKLGKNANPRLSRLITKSGAVEITDIRELRFLDRRLRLK